MKIEKIKLQFHPQCRFDQLQLTPIQQEYLAGLRNQESISELVIRYINMGWLVDFNALYLMIQFLALNQWIINPEVQFYFKNIQIKLQNNSQINLQTAASSIHQQNSYQKDELLQLPFLRSLPQELALSLLSKAHIKQYKAEQFICHEGRTDRDLYILLKGEAAVYRENSGHHQFLSFLASQSVFGEAAFFFGEKRTASVVAMKASDVLIIPYQFDLMDRYLNSDKAAQVVQRFWIQHALLKSDFFKNFPTDCLDALTFSGVMKSLHPQQVLFREGQISLAAYILIQGHLDVIQKQKTINRLHQGAFIGEVSLMVQSGLRTATVVSVSESLLVEFSRHDFYNLLSQNIYLAKEMQNLALTRVEHDKKRVIQN
ncbi:MAG: cyclic nucleotide-binding domain-containing protein [Pseudobdellovibrio sp.]